MLSRGHHKVKRGSEDLLTGERSERGREMGGEKRERERQGK